MPKSDPIFDFLGGLDLINSWVGLLIAQNAKSIDTKTASLLIEIQASCLEIGAATASSEPKESQSLKFLSEITHSLESSIDSWDSKLPELKNFILPGGSETAAIAQIVRVQIRSAERFYTQLDSSLKNEYISTYINRLSDYFFQLARFINHQEKIKDHIWLKR